jgi:Ca-activated chloride channel homolog
MKHIHPLFLAIFLLFFLTVNGQVNKVKGGISTTDTADLTILNIYPEKFPDVSVLFKAETRKGEPVWNLSKEKMRVTENTRNCTVVSMEQVSKNKPINLGIVVDHSGSMQEDMTEFFSKDGKALYTYDADFKIIPPKGYIPPIDNAKSAVKTFVSGFNTQKDFISIIGFSTRVDKQLPLTNDIGKINSIVDGMKADSSTALYDAMLTAINQLVKADGIKVLVVLTDGQDNSSRAKWKDVVDSAIKVNIPIYIIGLGYVNTDTLKLIANLTKGEAYFTKSSNSLSTVYNLISKKIQAFYSLVYNSSNLSSADSTRKVELAFDIDSIYLVSSPAMVNLPVEVVDYMKKKETQKEYLLYGGIAVSALIAAGVLLLYFKRRQKMNKPVIKKLYPNPANGSITVEIENAIGQLSIIDFSGQTVKVVNIGGTETNVDITALKEGNYIAVVLVNGQQSNAMKFIIRR